jgi:hypothetical protein
MVRRLTALIHLYTIFWDLRVRLEGRMLILQRTTPPLKLSTSASIPILPAPLIIGTHSIF